MTVINRLFFPFIARAYTFSSFLVWCCVLPHEHLGYILPLRLLPSLNVKLYSNWRDQRPQFKFVYYKPNERLVEKPTSYDRVLTCIQEWPSNAHLEYLKSWSKLKMCTAQKLKDKGAS